MIDYKRGHWLAVGRTQQGKTYTVVRTLQREKSGVLFFNTGLQPVTPAYIRADGHTDVDALIRALDAGAKINFIPHESHTVAEGQLSAIVRALFDGKKRDVHLVVDEAWEYRAQALTAMRKVARRGLYWGVHLGVIVQRLANLNNDLMTQCETLIVFALNLEKKYFQRYELPFDEFQRRIEAKGKYSYCVYSDVTVKGAYRYG